MLAMPNSYIENPDSFIVDKPETILAFDFGIKKIGVALGNTITKHASALCIIRPKTKVERFIMVADLLQDWQPERIIVGLPLNTDGSEQEASRASRNFARQLQGRFVLPVDLVDERGSSMEAQRILGTNADDDAVAAAVILQRYLDSI